MGWGEAVGRAAILLLDCFVASNIVSAIIGPSEAREVREVAWLQVVGHARVGSSGQRAASRGAGELVAPPVAMASASAVAMLLVGAELGNTEGGRAGVGDGAGRQHTFGRSFEEDVTPNSPATL